MHSQNQALITIFKLLLFLYSNAYFTSAHLASRNKIRSERSKPPSSLDDDDDFASFSIKTLWRRSPLMIYGCRRHFNIPRLINLSSRSDTPTPRFRPFPEKSGTPFSKDRAEFQVGSRQAITHKGRVPSWAVIN